MTSMDWTLLVWIKAPKVNSKRKKVGKKKNFNYSFFSQNSSSFRTNLNSNIILFTSTFTLSVVKQKTKSFLLKISGFSFLTWNHCMDGTRNRPHDGLDHLHEEGLPLLPRVLLRLVLRFLVALRSRGRSRPRGGRCLITVWYRRGHRRVLDGEGRGVCGGVRRRVLRGGRLSILNGVWLRRRLRDLNGVRRLRVLNGKGRWGGTDPDVGVGPGNRFEAKHQIRGYRMTDGRFCWGLKSNWKEPFINCLSLAFSCFANSKLAWLGNLNDPLVISFSLQQFCRKVKKVDLQELRIFLITAEIT